MRPLVAGADPHFEGFARLNSGDPTLGQHASMQKRIARPIGEFNETKSLFGVEPFDHPADRWPGRGLEPGLAEPGSGAECTRLRGEGISVELATPRIAEILISQLGFLEGDTRSIRENKARRPLAVTGGNEVWSIRKTVARVSAD